jgi:hypothetical protein
MGDPDEARHLRLLLSATGDARWRWPGAGGGSLIWA